MSGTTRTTARPTTAQVLAQVVTTLDTVVTRLDKQDERLARIEAKPQGRVTPASTTRKAKATPAATGLKPLPKGARILANGRVMLNNRFLATKGVYEVPAPAAPTTKAGKNAAKVAAKAAKAREAAKAERVAAAKADPEKVASRAKHEADKEIAHVWNVAFSKGVGGFDKDVAAQVRGNWPVFALAARKAGKTVEVALAEAQVEGKRLAKVAKKAAKAA